MEPSDQGTGAALEVEDFDEAILKLKVADISFAAEPFETPCCHMAVVQDPDGNKIIIHKLKPENEKGPAMIKEVAFVAVAVSRLRDVAKILRGDARVKAELRRRKVFPGWNMRSAAMTIGVGQHPNWQPSRDGTTVAFEVDDIDATIAKLKSAE